MSDGRAKMTREEASRIIEQVKEYHRHGRESLRDLPGRGGYGDKALDEAAKRLGWSPTKLRKARQFADRQHGYDRQRLAELCRLVREHRPTIGTAHVGLLVTVSWEEGRAELQRECVENNWSVATLEAAVKLRREARRKGGRRRRVGASPALALVQLGEMADSFLRWVLVAGEQPAGAGGGKSVYDALPRRVRERVEKARDALRELQQAVEPELLKARGRRAARG